MYGAALHADSLPVEGSVVSGSASIAQSADVMTINQSTSSATITWDSFSIGSGKTVNFIQPSSSSVALNKVLGSNPSRIFGTLECQWPCIFIQSEWYFIFTNSIC